MFFVLDLISSFRPVSSVLTYFVFFVLDLIRSFRPVSSVLSYFVLLCVLCGGQIRVKYSPKLLCVLCVGPYKLISSSFKCFKLLCATLCSLWWKDSSKVQSKATLCSLCLTL